MNKILRVVTVLPGILFVVIGVGWIIDPASAAAGVGMPLLEGVARSTQIGDLGAFFLTMGLLILIGVTTLKRVWFYPPMMLLGLAATFRIVAWLVHGAALAGSMIAVEVIVTTLLFVSTIRLCEKRGA
ncbi:MAG TPA: hypothetical protein EYG52_03290 [Pseudomonadales bacterium]|nr:hypothetical protein [Gammaproteobacteria bacterium]HIL82524.1 hypothetical protein [Pseudomonadales bacterium]